MSEALIELETLLRAVLADIAPDADVAGLGPDDDLRDTLDLDSVDFLNAVVAIHERTGIQVPERDYARLSTLAEAVAYLSAAQ